MENLLESNERTLDIFDSVCSGLAGCLALVHADIRQMIEHRDRLLCQLELESSERAHRDAYAETDLNYNEENKPDGDKIQQTNLDVTDSTTTTTSAAAVPTSKTNDAADPHHLAHLKLLDKRLADSFSQALSMCDQQKSSLFAKKNHLVGSSQSQRPSIFQVLLGKGNQNKSDKRRAKSQKDLVDGDRQLQLDTRAVVDDINRQTRLAMQYSKQLEAHLFKVEDLRAKYEMHLKMGLVVKSVSRAYLNSNPYSSSSLAASQHHLINSPNSLGRTRGQHHSSTLMVNDHSSLGTRSSLSSLNLSTWSFSRRQNSDRSAASRKNSSGRNCCQMMGHNDNVDGYNRSSTSSLARNQKCASTLSLDSMNKQRRLNLSKLISLTTAKHNNNQHHTVGPQDYHDHQSQRHNIDASQMIDCQCNIKHQKQHHIDSPVSPPLPSSHHGGSPYHSDIGPPSPSNAKPLYQYVYGTTAEFAIPTSAGTLAGGYVDARGSVVLGDQTHVGGGAGGGMSGLLHKSASHSSLKKGGRNHYKSSSGHSQHQIANHGAKTTIKEFIDNIERIEAEFESYMGSFLLNIEDIQGFARVCQGDVFEINIKYGDSQKFKTKISVLKENRQKCDHRQSVFKARIADVIAIKAYECKGLGKKVLLGHKLCETRDLFTARSQLMTISLNQTGSIKLNLVITWNPLHMTPKGHDISHVSLPPTPVSSSTLSSLSSARSSLNGVSVIATDNNTTLINIQANKSGSRKAIQDSPLSQQTSPTNKCLECADDVRCPSNSHRSHPVMSSREQQAIYQDADAIYSYHIPEPDYLTTGDVKY